METDGVCAKTLGDEIEEVDRLSNLPDCLVWQVLLNLPTKDVVKCSVLSSRWRDLCKYIPGLDLENRDFPDLNAFASFIDWFLGFNSESCLQNFKLEYHDVEPDTSHLPPWINTVVTRKVQHLHLLVMWEFGDEVEIPLTVYTCASLVSLKLCHVFLPHPKSVSLPCLKVIELDMVKFANNLAFEMLISGCPVLESLTLFSGSLDNVNLVCSQSLLRFTFDGRCPNGDNVLAIDAPRLEYLELFDYDIASFIINNTGSLVKVCLDVTFNLSFGKTFNPYDLPRNMIRNFLNGISTVKHMVISSYTLKVIYNYSRCERVPLFGNLFSLVVDFCDNRWEMLPIFLESCPNLKSLDLEFCRLEEGVGIFPGPRLFLTSLEYVNILNPMRDEATEMKLVSYFLENSTILKRFTLCLGDSRKNEEFFILEKLLTLPRLSSSCQIVIL